MKKKLFISLGLVGIIALSVAVGAYAANPIKLFINGKNVAADVQIIKGTSYVPLKVVGESLGAKVVWDQVTRSITITSGEAAVKPTPAEPLKSFVVDTSVTSGPMTMKISKVTFDPTFKESQYSSTTKKVIILDVEVENTSPDTINWYPDQGKIALNTKEQISADIFNSDSVGGEFIGKIIKKGKIVFETTSDFKDITSFTFKVNGASDAKTYSRVGEDQTVEVLLN